MDGILTDKIMKEWGPYANRGRDVLLYSMGSLDEGHGPALPRQIDDLTAQRTAVDVSGKTGFPYAGHLPYTIGWFGELERDWCPACQETEKAILGIINHIKNGVSIWRRDVSHVAIISGHGGNNLLKDREKELSQSVGVPVKYVAPFKGISVPSKYGEIIVTHADIGEHSVADYLGLLDHKKLEMLNKVAAKNPKEALTRWKPLMGLGWYVLFGGERYEHLRNPRNIGMAERFMKERKIIVDPELGRDLYNKNLDSVIKQCLEFSKT
jgi:creatinine amidohydrolase/Fe(II)-dependent formamide hydrolase-like protein